MRPPHTKMAIARFGVLIFDAINPVEISEFELSPSSDVQTIVVDRDHIYYNPEWVGEKTEREIEAVIRESIATYRVLG